MRSIGADIVGLRVESAEKSMPAQAKQLHARLIVSGHEEQEMIWLLSITKSCCFITYARLVFNTIKTPSTLMYNTMIRAYATSPHPQQALLLHNQMHRNGHPPPDQYTFTFLLKASSLLLHLPKGQETHCQSIKHGFHSNLFVQNSLLHLYGCNAGIQTARRVFDEMSLRDVATWTTLLTSYVNASCITSARQVFDRMPHKGVVPVSAMISGYVRRCRYKEALHLFRESQLAKLVPSASMLMGVLCACAGLGALDMGRWIHCYLTSTKGNQLVDSRMTTALIDMYFKCGTITEAVQVFVGAKQKQVGEWTAMISGMAMHGRGQRSIQLFEQMLSSGVRPNSVTFVALLSGCAHARLPNEGLRYFHRMKSEFRIKPTIEHFGCVVDFLGRSGRINHAVEFISEMPVEANAAIWGSLLNACRVHNNVEVGQIAARWLIKEEPQNSAIYMCLLGLYGETGKWKEAEQLKMAMKEVGSRKKPGCSIIEVNGVCHEFLVDDKSDPCAFELCSKLGKIVIRFRENTSLIFE